jgi:hypothetical protein
MRNVLLLTLVAAFLFCIEMPQTAAPASPFNPVRSKITPEVVRVAKAKHRVLKKKRKHRRRRRIRRVAAQILLPQTAPQTITA